jgi:hypothetical protein
MIMKLKFTTLFLSLFLFLGCSQDKPSEQAQAPKVVSRIPYGDDGHCTLRDDGWVVIESGGSKDMLPITLVSEELVKAFLEDIEESEE